MKTITLVDNGHQYSDHQIYLVEASEVVVQGLLTDCDFSDAYGNPYILASGMMDVNPGTGTMTLDELSERYSRYRKVRKAKQ